MGGRIYPLGAAFAIVLLLAGAAVAAGRTFPGTSPDESVRLNTPNDPGFDSCEPDDEDGTRTCASAFNEEYSRFGFAPAGSQNSAQYQDSRQLSPEQRAQNQRAGRPADAQISGVSADEAWKTTTGDASVDLGITDTGILWQEPGLRRKVRLNQHELPKPMGCARYDCDRDGAFTVDDYSHDSRVTKDAGHDDVADGVLDASDLIAVFSNGRDEDRNGYVDDIAGWDFFDDDNDPFDASSYSSGHHHGTGRLKEAGEAGNDGEGSIGVCPSCRVVPLRTWDSIVHDTNNIAEAALYAADNNIEVIGCACGGLFNTRFARQAIAYAYRHGVFFALVSSDLNTADHNFPTTYNEGTYIAGAIADVASFGSVIPNADTVLGPLGIDTDAPIRTWFRNSNVTQYGGHAHVVLEAPSGSENTGQATGAAGLLIGYSRRVADRLPGHHAVRPNEVKQLLTLTAEDVLPANTAGTGVPDPAHPGWDQHFGYGRVDLAAAVRAIEAGRIPPEALITAPDWFQPLEVGRRPKAVVKARMDARTPTYRFTVQAAPGIEPAESEFQTVAAGSGRGEVERTVATLDLRAMRERIERRGGGGTPDPAAPARPPGAADPNEPAFTVRIRVTDSRGITGEDRKVMFAYRDPSLRPDWPIRMYSGGEQSPRFYDLDSRPGQEIVLPTSSGALRVLHADGRPARSFNHGLEQHTGLYANVHRRAPAYRYVKPPREVLATPAIGDIDGDGGPEIVVVGGEHIYAWHADGTRVKGWPVRVDPAFSAPAVRTEQNHVKRGFFGAAALGDLNGDGKLEVVASGLDQRLYAFDGRGRSLPGFPVHLQSPGLAGAESINSPAIGDIAGDSRPEIVVPTNEVDPAADSSGLTADPEELLRNLAINVLAQGIGGSGRIYAIDGHGKLVPGWPAKPNGALPDILPLVGPGVDQVLGNFDSDPKLEIVSPFATGTVVLRDGDGSVIRTLDPTIGTTGDVVDRSLAVNVFENPVIADFDGGGDLEVLKGGLSVNVVLNLLLAGQNLPFNHLVQAWHADTGESLAAFPKAQDDWQLLSSPAVADIGGGAGQEALAGSGLYLLHAYQPSGAEPPGWPKFTGGWELAVPAVGDVDGDGKSDVVISTREGFAFLWDADRPACPIGQWPSFRHDARNDGNYSTDGQPPGPVSVALSGRRVTTGHAGDDGACGEAAATLLRYATRPLRSAAEFQRAHRVVGGELPAGARYVAAAAVDDAGNQGPITVKRIR